MVTKYGTGWINIMYQKGREFCDRMYFKMLHFLRTAAEIRLAPQFKDSILIDRSNKHSVVYNHMSVRL